MVRGFLTLHTMGYVATTRVQFTYVPFPDLRPAHNALFSGTMTIVIASVMLPDDAKSLDADAMTKSQGSTGYVQAESLEKVWEVINADALWENGVVRTM